MDGISLEKKLAWIDEQRRKEAEVIRRLPASCRTSPESWPAWRL